jgi:hypothetical protein
MLAHVQLSLNIPFCISMVCGGELFENFKRDILGMRGAIKGMGGRDLGR